MHSCPEFEQRACPEHRRRACPDLPRKEPHAPLNRKKLLVRRAATRREIFFSLGLVFSASPCLGVRPFFSVPPVESPQPFRRFVAAKRIGPAPACGAFSPPVKHPAFAK
jgi:hypothetical protein